MAIPGVKTTILDRFYTQARTDLPGGPLVAVIAKRGNTATAASPDLTAYLSSSEQDIITQFGENSHIHRAYYELATSGAPRIAVIPLPSNTAFNQTTAVLTSATYVGSLPLFDAAVAAAESARADILVLWGRGSDATDWNDAATPATPGDNLTDYFYADNSVTLGSSWLKRLVDACDNITVNSHPIVGVIGLKGIRGTENPSPSDVATGLLYPTLVSKEAVVSPSAGHLVSVVSAEFHILGAPASWGWQNGACAYAATMARLDAWSSTTGKPVYNVDSLRYGPTRSQLESLTSKGIAPVSIDFQRVARYVDGVTFALNNSDYSRLTTVRIVFDAVKLIRNISQNYIGETMSVERQQAFQTQISSALQSMQKLGAINNSDFRVLYSPKENKASVDLALTPAFELREVIISVSVNF